MPLLVPLAMLGLLAIIVVLAATPAQADPAPMVDPPTTNGPYYVGYTYDTIRTSTNSYDTPLKTYYPAIRNGRDVQADKSAAPYPAILWMHGTGGNQESYQSYLVPLCSWGFVVVSIGYLDAYFPSSCDPADINDILDLLEACNANSSRVLYGMVNASAYGLSGHSAGGGLSLWNGAYVSRIKAVQTLAAAIATSGVDGIAARFNRPLLMQAGDQDPYTEGSDACWAKFKCTRAYFRIIGGTHNSGFQGDVFFSFFLYYLSGKQEYREFVYGDYVIDRHLESAYNLDFQVNETGEFFPPRLAATIEPPDAAMDSPVLLNGTILGSYIHGDPRGTFTWDLGGAAGPYVDRYNTTYAVNFTDPIELDATFSYTIGRLSITIPAALHLSVHNVEPVAAFTHGELTVDMDSLLALDASATYDTDSDVGTLTYTWDLGEGEPLVTTSVPLAEHTYTRPGAYTVALTVTDRHGASSTATVSVTVVNVPPIAGIRIITLGDPISVSEDEHFELPGVGNDTPTDRQRLKYMWDFGDGTGSEWSSSGYATHQYIKAGNFTPVLTVKDPAGAVAKAWIDIEVYNVVPTCEVLSPHQAEASFDEDAEVQFRGSADDTPTDLDTLQYMWDFGDGDATAWGPLSTATAVHVYPRSSTYIAAIHAKDDDGVVGSAEVTVTVRNLPPTASIVRPGEAVTVNEDTAVAFEGMGSDTPSDQAGLGYWWDLDGALPIRGTSAEYAFNSSGKHRVTFTVNDPEGEVATAVVVVTVVNLLPEATAELSPLEIRTGGVVNFSCTVSDTPSDQGTLKVRWEFGDGGAAYIAKGNHTYAAAGNYTVTMTVTDNGGESATRTFKVRVDAPPVIPPVDVDEPGVTSRDMGRTVAIGLAIVAAVVVIVVLVLWSRRRAAPTTTATEISTGAGEGSEGKA
jgi:PKD repeat protein